jgi:hypothetical protein
MKSAILAVVVAMGVGGFAASSYAEGSQIKKLTAYSNSSQQQLMQQPSAATALAIAPNDMHAALPGAQGGPAGGLPPNSGLASGTQSTAKASQ